MRLSATARRAGGPVPALHNALHSAPHDAQLMGRMPDPPMSVASLRRSAWRKCRIAAPQTAVNHSYFERA